MLVSFSKLAGIGTSLPGVVEAESPWFVRSRIRIESGRSVVVPNGQDPVVAIQVSDGLVEVRNEEGASVGTTEALGGWIVLDADMRHELRATAGGAVTVVLVQVLGP